MPANDLELLVDAAKSAGEIASPFWRKSPKTWEKTAGAGPVTEADLAVNEMLQERLMAARPDYGWLSEETEDDTERLSRDRVFIVDPIDGTRSFIAGEKTWAHSLAIAEHGQIISAAVFLPLRDKLYTAQLGQGAQLNGQPIKSSGTEEIEGSDVLSAKPNLDPRYWQQNVPPFKRHFRASLAYRLSLVAEGRFDAMLTLRDTWEWDVAAGALIVSEAGGKVTDRIGRPPVFNNPHPTLSGMIAGNQFIQPKICCEICNDAM